MESQGKKFAQPERIGPISSGSPFLPLQVLYLVRGFAAADAVALAATFATSAASAAAPCSLLVLVPLLLVLVLLMSQSSRRLIVPNGAEFARVLQHRHKIHAKAGREAMTVD